MNNCGFIVRVKDLRLHSNADRLQIATFFQNDTIVSLETKVGDLGIYFPTDLQLSEEFCLRNSLLRKDGGYLENEKRNIRAIKLRGEKSEGIFMPISSLSSFGSIDELKEGETLSVFNGHEICRKYIPPSAVAKKVNTGKAGKTKKKVKSSVIFPEHISTPQFQYSLGSFKPGDHIIITEKLEGTSMRSSLLPVIPKQNWFQRLFKIKLNPIYKDFYGSRRVVIDKNSNSGFYGTNSFRKEIHEEIKPYLLPNMVVFGEIVGWPGIGRSPLMGEVDTSCLNDKEFSKKYGKKMVFHYGCANGEYDFYIYRICELDKDGNVRLEYSTHQIKDWCEMRGFKFVPILYEGIMESEEQLIELMNKYCDGESTLAAHWREGCVVRRENRSTKFDVYKLKNFNYKVMKGLAVEKLTADEVDSLLLEEM